MPACYAPRLCRGSYLLSSNVLAWSSGNMKKYYVLAVFEDGKWSPQFGAYDKSDVQFEFQTYKESYRAHRGGKDLKIITLPSGDRATLELHMAKLNKLETV
jgi:hypothetical protein